MNKRWNLLPVNHEKVSQLKEQIRLPEALCKILVQRNIDTLEAYNNYINPGKHLLHDPFIMKDMQAAVTRILTALNNNEKILVFGDYDVDGTTAVACMYSFLKKYVKDTALLDYYIPDRYREGYGISKAGIDYAFANGYTLIISLDCGIKSTELIAFAKEMGIDFIVCDHHLPGPELPDAVAILNPKQPDCNYPYKELCGCGVGYKLICALLESFGKDSADADIYLGLTATAIAADIVPMTGENRVLATLGLKHINKNPGPAITALLKESGASLPLNISNLVFLIAPRINAAGRMESGKLAVELFIETDTAKAQALAQRMQVNNTNRKEVDRSITQAALQMIKDSSNMQHRKSTVVFNSGWHKGVVGIVASRLIERHYKPTIVLTESNGLVSGSARGIAGFNLYEAIYACREHLTTFGGHFAAAGLSMLPHQLEAFSEKFEEVSAAVLTEEMLRPQIIIDVEINLSEINQNFYNDTLKLEPYGPENLRPIFITRNVKDKGSRIVKEDHARMIVEQNGIFLTGIGFNLSETFKALDLSKPFDIVYTLDENEWNGNKSIQMKVIDMRNNL